MNLKSSRCIIATAFVAVAIPAQLAAQKKQQQVHHKYKLFDLGAFGGPGSQFSDGNPPYIKLMNNRGIAVGAADRSTPDPYFPNCLTDCFVALGFQFQNGAVTKLGALPGVNTSFPFAINERDVVIGVSENGTVDPLTGFPELDPVRWVKGRIHSLGTLAEPRAERSISMIAVKLSGEP